MPKLGKQDSFFKKNWMLLVTILAVLFLFAASLWARFESKKETDSQNEFIQKGIATNYVCEILGGDPEQNIIAVRCFTK